MKKTDIHLPVAYAYRLSLNNNKACVGSERSLSEAGEEIQEKRESGSRKLDGRVEKLRSWGKMHSEQRDVRFPGNDSPGWRQVPFNLTGVLRTKSVRIDRQISNSDDESPAKTIHESTVYVNRS